MDSAAKPRRRMVLRIGSGFLPLMFTEGLKSYCVTKDPFPADTEIVGASMTPDMRTLVLLLESEAFPEVPSGELYPEITPTLSQANL